MISKLQCFCPQNKNVLYLTRDILETCLRGDRRSGNLVGQAYIVEIIFSSDFSTQYVSRMVEYRKKLFQHLTTFFMSTC